MIPKELIEKYPDYTLQQHISAGHLDAFTQSNIPTTEMFEFAKQVIELSDSYRSYWSRKVCAICDKKLTESDYATITHFDFLFTCDEHKKCRDMYQAELARKELKYPPRNTNFLK